MAGGLRVNPAWRAWFDEAATRFVWRVTDEVHDDAVDFVTKGKTRRLVGSIRPVYLFLRGQVWVGRAAVEYWRDQEYGARPHVIRPRKKQALWWAGAAHPVRKVRHPGNKAVAYMRRALYTRREFGGRL